MEYYQLDYFVIQRFELTIICKLQTLSAKCFSLRAYQIIRVC